MLITKWSELDELVMDAAFIATEQEGVNPAILQRDLGIQYNRAGRLVDQLESEGGSLGMDANV